MASGLPSVVVSHWSTLIENLQASPLQFYQSVEAALTRRQVPETKNSRVDYKESGVLSAQREYLHITRERMIFDVCAAPFGTGFFVSWWLAEKRPMLNPAAKMTVLLGMLATATFIVVEFGLIIGTIVLTLI